MSYGFDRLTDRFGTFSYKWDVGADELPMWVADMDFETAPAVRRAIEKRAAHGVYGYSMIPDEYFESASRFWGRRHGFAIPTEWMIYTNGVVAAISSVVRRLTHPAEKVLIQAPVYNIFYNSIVNNGRIVISSDLVYDGGKYSVDWIDLERKLSDPQTTLMILCNPHNPTGNLWTREELARIGDLCLANGVTVLSDEIHCALVEPGKQYVPFSSLEEKYARNSVSCISASKAFNLAGLQSAIAVCPDPQLRQRVYRGINNDEVGEPNCFSMCASVAAYTECDGWLDGLVDYLFDNRRLAEQYIKERIGSIRPVKAEATYLMWIDISALTDDSVSFTQWLRESTGLYLSEGEEYGECGRAFVRLNLATQRERLLDGLSRLERGVGMYLDAKKSSKEKQ